MIIDTIKSNLIVHVKLLLLFVCFKLRSDQMEPEKSIKIFHENDCAQNGCHGFILWRRNILNIWSLRKFNFQRISVIFRHCGLNSVSLCKRTLWGAQRTRAVSPTHIPLSIWTATHCCCKWNLPLKIWRFNRRILIDYLGWFVS